MESICAESGITGVVLGESGAGTGAGAGAYDCENEEGEEEEEGDCYPSPAWGITSKGNQAYKDMMAPGPW